MSECNHCAFSFLKFHLCLNVQIPFVCLFVLSMRAPKLTFSPNCPPQGHRVRSPRAGQTRHHARPQLRPEQVARRGRALRRHEHHLPRHRSPRLAHLRHERQLLPRGRVHSQSPHQRRLVSLGGGCPLN